jgi:hypothetical protein
MYNMERLTVAAVIGVGLDGELEGRMLAPSHSVNEEAAANESIAFSIPPSLGIIRSTEIAFVYHDSRRWNQTPGMANESSLKIKKKRSKSTVAASALSARMVRRRFPPQVRSCRENGTYNGRYS